MGFALRRMRESTAYIGADAALNGLFVLQKGVHMGVRDLWETQVVVSIGEGVHDVVPEGGVAARALVFVLRHEDSLAAASARIDAGVLSPPVRTCERSLSAGTLSDEELVWSELLLELLSDLSLVLSQPLLVELLALECALLAIRRIDAVMDDGAISLDCHVL